MPIQHELNNFFWIFSVWIFIIGACIGSFLNVCIWRLPRGMSIIHPPSACPFCGHNIRWYENIPLLSWFLLQGKCSACKHKISIRYLLIEFLCATIYLLIWIKVYFSDENIFALLRYCIVVALAITTFFIDIRHFIIPDATTYPVMFYGLLLSLIFPPAFGMNKWTHSLLFSLAGFSFALIFMSASAIIGKSLFKKDALGWGDVKYMSAIGTLLGLPGAFFTLLAGSICGTIFGIILIIYKGKNLKTAIPFGPFLALASTVWIFFGEKVLKVYFYLSDIFRTYV